MEIDEHDMLIVFEKKKNRMLFADKFQEEYQIYILSHTC